MAGYGYKRLATDCDLSLYGLNEALTKLGFLRPTLFVHQEGVDTALDIAASARFPVLVRIDPLITDTYEWYVTWNGDAVGSPGA